MSRNLSHRRGYALILVVIFCVIFTTLIALAWRRMASTIYTFSAHADQIQQDQGAMLALADAMRTLEVGPPPFTSDSPTVYACYDTVSVPTVQNLMLQEGTETSKCYSVTFTLTGDHAYSVQVVGGTPAGRPLNSDDFGSLGP